MGEPAALKVTVAGLKSQNPAAVSMKSPRPCRRHHTQKGRSPGSEAHGEYARACGARVNHRSAVRPGDDSFTAPELAATRPRRTMTAAHAASLILNKCFKVQTPAGRNARAGRGGGEQASRGGQGRGGQGWSPTRPSRRAVAHRWVPAALAAAFPLAPLLSVASYIIARADPNGSGARAAGAAGQRCSSPEPEGLPTQLPRDGGKGPSACPTRPLAKALGCGRSPSGSRERHQLRQLLQTPCPVSLQPRSRHRGARAAGRAGRRVSGEDKVPGDPPVARSAQPRHPHPCPGVGNLGPPAARDPSSPLSSQGSRGESSPGPSGRTTALESSQSREATPGVPEHRSYLALGRPRSGRAARGAWCTSARAWGGR